jgi:hypothetical protein
MIFPISPRLCTAVLAGLLILSPRLVPAQPSDVRTTATAAVPASLSQADALADLAAFGQRLREEAAYLTLHQAEPFKAIEVLRQRLPAQIGIADFVRELQKILAPIGDCHSSVSHRALANEPSLCLPFRLATAKGGIVAVTRENTSFVEPDFPYLVAIDGRPLRDWLDAALVYAPIGSASQNLSQSVAGIRRLDILRRDLGLPARRDVDVTFANVAGQNKQVSSRCSDRSSSLAKIQIGTSRRLGDLGYLRLPEMDDKLIPEAKRRMEEFRGTSGLIIDVRGNGGGRYGLMRALFGYFRPSDAGPFVCNIAAYRRAPQFRADHIEYRPTYRRDWSGWSDPERVAIDDALAKFKPSFDFPSGQFSEWHFMLLKQDAFHYYYDKPVIVLCDESCLSATDGFLAAFAELPNVTLMGVASRGGSGSSRTVALPRSKIDVRLSTMASFRPSGATFDGQGVAVDIVAQPPPEDYITGKDSVLAQAVQRL